MRKNLLDSYINMTSTQQDTRSPKFVHHLAHLARLKLTEKEEQRLEREFAEIVAYVDQVERVPATFQPLAATITGVQHVLREDAVVPSTLAGALCAQAPDVAEGYVRVPPIQ